MFGADIFKYETSSQYLFIGHSGGGAGGGSIDIYDISNSNNPLEISSYTSPYDFSAFKIVGNYILISSSPPHPLADPSGPKLEVVDISNPAKPTEISESKFNGGELLKDISLNDGILTFSEYGGGTQTIDYTDITDLKIVSSTPDPEVFVLIDGILPSSTALSATTTINFGYRSTSGIATTSATLNGAPIFDGQQITFNTPGTTTLTYFATSVAGATTSFTQQIYVQSPMPEFISSSSAQVGSFTVVANCTAISADSLASVGEIDILKGSSTLQTILTTGIAPGGNDYQAGK